MTTPLKSILIKYKGLAPIEEANSTSGGVSFEALNENLMLKAMPGVFCADEMLDWKAPTGGYLITTSLATGRWAGAGATQFAKSADIVFH